MNFSIIHLSDLHVEATSQNIVLGELAVNIKEQCKYLDNIIIAVTGDIVNCALYSESTKKAIIDFFELLLTDSHLKNAIKSIQFVPGNHDRHHNNSIDNILIDQIRQNCADGSHEDNLENAWNYHLVSYKEYLELINTIRSLFMKNPKIVKDTTYWEQVDIEQSSIAFINIDTSWSSKGGHGDYQHLSIDFDKLSVIREEYQAARRRRTINFTIALAHHPLNWLTYSDSQKLQEWLLDQEYFETNLYLCGHTHDRKVVSLQDNTQGFLTLVTGIGWPRDQASNDKDHRRYSIYTIDTKNRTCSVRIRKTNQNLKFRPDQDVLVTERDQRISTILLPLQQRENGAFIEAASYQNKTPSFLLVTDSILNKISILAEINADFQSHMKQFQESHIRKLFVDCELNKVKSNQLIVNTYTNYFYACNKGLDNGQIKILLSQIKNKQSIYRRLLSFLQEMCSYFITTIQNHRNDLQLCSDVRIHFRRGYFPDNVSTPIYIAICQHSTENITHSCSEIRDVSYKKSLIECSFLSDKCFTYSHNQSFGGLEPKEWKDFLTMAPKVTQNTMSRSRNGRRREFPYLSCGISVHDMDDSQFLDLLAYLKIDNLFKTIILEYVELFNLNFDEFFAFLENNMDLEEESE